MIKYIAVLESSEITLGLMGRKKTFTNNQEVTEDAYTKFYPQYFKRIGVINGYKSFLATPVFVPDGIQDFIDKETVRKKELNITKVQKPKLIEVDEIAEAAVEFLDEIKSADIDTLDEVETIEDLIEELQDVVDDFDVKIETEE